MPGPNPNATPGTAPTPADYASASAFETADAVAQYGDAQIQDLLARAERDRLPEAHIKRQVRIYTELGARAMRLAELSGVETGAHLINQMADDARRLRRMKGEDFLKSDPLHDFGYRGAFTSAMSEVTGYDLPGLRARTEELKGPAAANTSTGQPASGETDPSAAFIEKLIGASAALEGVGLYGDIPGSLGLRDMVTGKGQQIEQNNNFGVTISAWKKVPTGEQHRAFQQSNQPKDAVVEAVAFTPLSEPKRELVEKGKPGTLWRAATPDRYKNTSEQKYVDTPNGRERSVVISYLYKPGWHGQSVGEAVNNVPYREVGGGRPSGAHGYALEVPESLANEYKEMLQQDPALARKIGDALVQKYAPEDYKKGWNEEKARAGTPGVEDHHFYPTYNTLHPETPTHVYDATGADATEYPDYTHSTFTVPKAA